ncbi:Ff.00g033760.m01.CDS01 [Fusarium sp. VM40]|nr:Ff.00g033760.m01.CDS01 [Fusarium sp. VM40]
MAFNMSSVPDYDDLPKVEGMPKGCAWGVFDQDGKKDKVGTLNFLTPEVVRNAALEVKDGVSISLNWPINAMNKLNFPGRAASEHKILYIPESMAALPFDQGKSWDDEISFNTQCSSQWDSLCHFQHQDSGLAYNGANPDREALSVDSTDSNTMPTLDHWHSRGCLAGRGVLLDYAAYAEEKGLDFHPFDGNRITVEDLEACAAHQDVEFRPGDILLVRTGATEVVDKMDPIGLGKMAAAKLTGLHGCEETARWLWNKRFAAAASDSSSFEAFPPLKPDGSVGGMKDLALHTYCLSFFGMSIGELWDLSKLAILIVIWMNGEQYAVDSSEQQTSTNSEYLSDPISISYPNTGLQFNNASSLLLLGIPTQLGTNILIFAFCDLNDDVLDTGLLFNIKGCVDCDTNINIDCVTSTVTAGAAEEIGAPETIKVSVQALGTVLVTVQAVDTTTTEGSITTMTEAPPTTTEATIIITTAEPTTSGIVETYSVSSDIVTEDTTAQTTTAEVKQTAAADTIEATTSSAAATEDPAQTTNTEAEPVTTSEAANSGSATLDINTNDVLESIAATSAGAVDTQTSAIGTTDVVSSDETETATLSTAVETVSQSTNAGTTTESLPIQKTVTATGTDSPSSIETASSSTSQATSEYSTDTSTGSVSQLSSAVTVSNSQTIIAPTPSTSDIHASTAKSSLASAQTDISASPTSIIETIGDHIATPSPTAGNDYTKGYNVTKTESATTVTTVVYTTVNPHKPDCLATTEIAINVGYTPCNCAHQTLPPVDMTTVVVPCQSCDPYGENSISLTVPAAACETGAKSTGKSHGQPEGDSQGHSGDKSYPMPGPNEQAGPQPIRKQHIHTVSEGGYGEIESHSAYQKNGQTSALPHKDFPTSNDKHSIYPTAVHGNNTAVHTETPQQPAQHGLNGQGQGGFSKTYITQILTVAVKTQGSNSTILHTGVPSYGPHSPIAATGAIKFSPGLWYLASVVCGAFLLLAA